MLVSARAVDASSALRDAEVEHLRDEAVSASGEEDVLRLEIAVDDPRAVGGHDGRADGKHDVDQLARVHASGAHQPCRQVFAGQELHDQEAVVPSVPMSVTSTACR